MRERDGSTQTIIVEHEHCTADDCNLEADPYPHHYRSPVTGLCASHAKGKTPKWIFHISKEDLQLLTAGAIPEKMHTKAMRILEKA